MPEQAEKFDQWGIVEVMGHRKYAGHITEQVIAGSALIRIDVPEVDVPKRYEHDSSAKSVPAYTKLVGIGSIYAITPTTEDIARAAAIEIARYESDVLPVRIPEERRLPAPAAAEADLWDGGSGEREEEAGDLYDMDEEAEEPELQAVEDALDREAQQLP